MGKQLELPVQIESEGVGNAAVRRYYADQGKRLEVLRLGITNLTSLEIFVHALNIRFPVRSGDSHLCVLKALHDDGPLIAFASGYNLADALFAMGGRMRSGGLEWKQDSFPQDEWEKKLAWCIKNRHIIE